MWVRPWPIPCSSLTLFYYSPKTPNWRCHRGLTRDLTRGLSTPLGLSSFLPKLTMIYPISYSLLHHVLIDGALRRWLDHEGVILISITSMVGLQLYVIWGGKTLSEEVGLWGCNLESLSPSLLPQAACHAMSHSPWLCPSPMLLYLGASWQWTEIYNLSQNKLFSF